MGALGGEESPNHLVSESVLRSRQASCWRWRRCRLARRSSTPKPLRPHARSTPGRRRSPSPILTPPSPPRSRTPSRTAAGAPTFMSPHPLIWPPGRAPRPPRPSSPAKRRPRSWDATTEEEEPADVLGAEQERLKRAPPPQDGDLVPVGEPIEVTGGAIELSRALCASERGGRDARRPALADGNQGFLRLPTPATTLCCWRPRRPIRSSATSPWPGSAYDPFAPLGTRIGSFTLFSGVEADGDYNSNLFASPEALGDTSLEVRPAVRLASNWSTHALEVRASGDLSFHDKYPTEDNRAYLVEGLGRLDITRLHEPAGVRCARGGAGEPLRDQRQLCRHAPEHRRRSRARRVQSALQPPHRAAARRRRRHELRNEYLRGHGAEQRRSRLHPL